MFIRAFLAWQAEGVQPPPKIVPTHLSTPPSEIWKNPQLPLIKPKCSPFSSFFCDFPGSPLVGDGCLPWLIRLGNLEKNFVGRMWENINVMTVRLKLMRRMVCTIYVRFEFQVNSIIRNMENVNKKQTKVSLHLLYKNKL